MKRRLPPLGCLRAFAVGGRELKLSRAAEELNVTPSAVSHMIRRLEDDLNVKLFRRNGREIELTDAGRKLLPAASAAFDLLQNAVDELAKDTRGGTLTVSARPYFAMKWLSPRIGKLWSFLPDAEIRLRNTNSTIDFESEGVDIDIDLRGSFDDPRYEVSYLMPGALTPICSPDLIKGDSPLRTPEDLCRCTLLRDTKNDFWPEWLDAVGLRDLVPAHNLYSDSTIMRVQLALSGQGIELGCLPLVSDEIAAGSLVAPFDFVLDSFAFCLVKPLNLKRKPSEKVAVLTKWLIEEARA
ncbi:LysR family transcriptional regulator [Mesorhizobium sp. M1A.T.Ca.IN.004.03.1.1]|uniref:LysR family transcriptional regulator n=1 Tax=Mesorhizobium sp. M1A.T.Ca.IN.004.03.1.1 TaxID=2496795 RepID=UPI000FC9BC66|nr:LysR family transcriptional regulator [Mesorhizobium sp. M1A.T.Ca.IN.004.03.1.1]RUV41273.1 LysR family transcriptional regulator [Mesorhizobium sp. M1A.T.Ca.IN.004.03.1.1]